MTTNAVSEGASAQMDGLPSQQRFACVLREIEGLTTEEMCKILEVTRTNLGLVLYRARNRLRDCLEAKDMREQR